jgi:hypothetical protein
MTTTVGIALIVDEILKLRSKKLGGLLGDVLNLKGAQLKFSNSDRPHGVH